MLKNYFKTAFRSLIRNKTFSFITILGLAGGLTCAMLILTFVVDELSYDKFHSKKENIYRLRYKISDFDIARVPPIFKEHLNDFFPEIEASARMFSRSVSVRVKDASGSENRFEEGNVNFSDPEIFRIFDFKLVDGNLENALKKPFTVILNEEIALKYFNTTQASGRTIFMEGDNSFLVVAVVKDFPSNSHTHFDMIVPYENMYDLEPESLQEGIRTNFQQNWMVSHSPTYVLLKNGADPSAVNARFIDFIKEKIPENQQKNQSFEIQPLLDIHLNDDVMAQSESPGSKLFIYIFIAVGFLTLLIACINFINLSTAKSLQRSKEIGMRKVLGAWKTNLIAQFLGESFMTTLIAAILSFWFTLLLLPQLNFLTGKELNVTVLYQPEIISGAIVIILITSLLAGLYPSFFVTKFPTLNNLKGLTSSTSSSLSFRKSLIIVQFSISIILIASTLIVFDQLGYMRSKPLGFKKDFIINVPIQSSNFNSVFGGVDSELRQKLISFEDEIAKYPGVLSSTLSNTAPGFGMVNRNVIPDGFTAQDNMLSPVMAVDYDFLDTYEIGLIAGRNFSEKYGADHESAFLINKKAVTEFNFGTPEDALGKEINLEGKIGKVVGVTEDFNFLSLSESMRPLILDISVPQFSVFSIKLNNQNVPTTLEQIEATWNDFFPNETFDHSFLDESLASVYQSQEQFGRLIGYFAFLAIFISCMGSYGLIMFIASYRKKEVGVRKVLGASVTNVVALLSRQFIVLAIISIVISIPVTLYISDLWLDEFSYRVGISPFSFIIASFAAILLVLGTVSIQAYRAAVANPVNSLRTE